MTTNVAKLPLRQHFVDDLLASIVVFLVALPLCMGIAIASGAPPESGLLTGIIGGLVVSVLGGCQLQVTGPAAGLAVVVVELVHKFGFEKMAIIIAAAGLLQVAAGAFKLAQWFRAVPPSVIHGMLSGIGVSIFASQFHVMIDDAPKGSGINNLISIPTGIMKAITPDASLTHEEAALVGIITLVTLLIWEKGARSLPLFKSVPSSLVAIAMASAITFAYRLPIKLVSLPDNLMSAIHLPTFNVITNSLHTDIFGAAVMVAFIASAETLLTAAALDKMRTGSRTNYDRELMAQGVGNTLSGVLGGLPMTGVMVRSGVNLSAGARTRLSAFLHGGWLLLAVVLIPHVVSRIPTSALAALLVFAGWKLANFKVLKELKRYGKGEIAIWIVTVGLIVFTDLLTGVLTGVALAAAKLLYTFSKLDIDVKVDVDGRRTDMTLKGVATFLVLPRLAEALESVEPDMQLHVHLDGLDFIDHACLDLLESWDKSHKATGGTLVLDWESLSNVYHRQAQPAATAK
jgi:MFS superfamily sulfate permease-like transporter